MRSSKVQYAYADLSSGDCLTAMIYPNGREVDYDYASGLYNTMGRLSSISDSSRVADQSWSLDASGNSTEKKRGRRRKGVGSLSF